MIAYFFFTKIILTLKKKLKSVDKNMVRIGKNMEDNNKVQKHLFGLNIILPKKSTEEIKHSEKTELEKNGSNFFVNNVDEKMEVYNGNVTKEIRKYQSMIYALGQASREGQPISTFKMDM